MNIYIEEKSFTYQKKAFGINRGAAKKVMAVSLLSDNNKQLILVSGGFSLIKAQKAEAYDNLTAIWNHLVSLEPDDKEMLYTHLNFKRLLFKYGLPKKTITERINKFVEENGDHRLSIRGSSFVETENHIPSFLALSMNHRKLTEDIMRDMPLNTITWNCEWQKRLIDRIKTINKSDYVDSWHKYAIDYYALRAYTKIKKRLDKNKRATYTIIAGFSGKNKLME